MLTISWLHSRTVELVQPQRRTARTDDVKEVIKVMQHSPTAAYLRECSFHERMMLAAVIKCVKREGVEEIKWGDVITFVPSPTAEHAELTAIASGTTAASDIHPCPERFESRFQAHRWRADGRARFVACLASNAD
jgi:hypothetical protein